MDKSIIDNIIRSNRKTLGLQISKDATLIIRAPMNMPIRQIEFFVKKKKNWILEHQNSVRKYVSATKPKKYLDGERFLFLGKFYPLTFENNVNNLIEFQNDKFVVDISKKNYAKSLLANWYCSKANKIIFDILDKYTKQYNFSYERARIGKASKSFGTCNGKGYINYTWRLVMAPIEVIEYIVVHELVHLVELNHSKSFWNKVQEIIPNYKKQEKWLKENAHLMYL